MWVISAPSLLNGDWIGNYALHMATGVYLTAWLGVPLIFGLDYIRKRVAWRLTGRPE